MDANFKNINTEQWKYTNVNQFKNFEFKCIENNSIINNPDYDISISNNSFSLSKKLNKNIVVYSLEESIKKNKHNINELIKNEKNDYKNPFIDLNNSNNGVLIHIKYNSIINNPIKIKFDCKKQLEKKFTNNKIFILIDDNVDATIILDEHSSEICYLNSLLRFIIKKNSIINFIHYSQKSHLTQIFNFLCSIKENSTLNLFPVDIKGKLIKKNYYILHTFLFKFNTFLLTVSLGRRNTSETLAKVNLLFFFVSLCIILDSSSENVFIPSLFNS